MEQTVTPILPEESGASVSVSQVTTAHVQERTDCVTDLMSVVPIIPRSQESNGRDRMTYERAPSSHIRFRRGSPGPDNKTSALLRPDSKTAIQMESTRL